MSTDPINYEAVLADLEAKKAQIEAAIVGVRMMLGATQAPSTPGGITSTQVNGVTGIGAVTSPVDVPSGAFHRKSIPEATKIYLSMVKKPQSTHQVMTALEKGGLHPSKYATVWSILYRRESETADICRVKGDWALSEWYPHMKKEPKPRKRTKAAEAFPEGV